MTELKDFLMGIGATAGWRSGLSGEVLKRIKLMMRQEVATTFPKATSDLWVSPTQREGYDPENWKTKPGFLTSDEKTFVSAIDALGSQDELTPAPLAWVNANLELANKAHGYQFSARETAQGEESLKGCYVINNIWKHTDSYTILSEGQPWILEYVDKPSGQSAQVPMQACVMYECLLDDCR